MASKPKNFDPLKRAWIRELECVARWHPAHRCVGVVQCCHDRHGVKKDDKRMYPGCVQLHTEEGQKGRAWIEERYGLDIVAICDSLEQAFGTAEVWV
jgi:hypothetical protein